MQVESDCRFLAVRFSIGDGPRKRQQQKQRASAFQMDRPTLIRDNLKAQQITIKRHRPLNVGADYVYFTWFELQFSLLVLFMSELFGLEIESSVYLMNSGLQESGLLTLSQL